MCDPIVNYGVNCLDKEDGDGERVRYPLTKELLMEFMQNNSGRVWSVKKGRSERMA